MQKFEITLHCAVPTTAEVQFSEVRIGGCQRSSLELATVGRKALESPKRRERKSLFLPIDELQWRYTNWVQRIGVVHITRDAYAMSSRRAGIHVIRNSLGVLLGLQDRSKKVRVFWSLAMLAN